MAWTYLLIAGVLEVAWATGLKFSEGFTRPWISAATFVGMILSFVFLSAAMRHLPLGTAYVAWTGIGAVGTAILGIVLFGEGRDLPRLLCIALIVVGVVGLRFLSPQE